MTQELVQSPRQSGDACGHAEHSARFGGLEGLRGIAALSVAAFHSIPILELLGYPHGLFRLGQQGVAIFFVLSGFVITRSTLRPSTFAARPYARARSVRILPAFWASFALLFLYTDAGQMATQPLRTASQALLIHGWLYPDQPWSLGVWWTLGIEASFYALLGVTAPLLRRPTTRWLLVAAMLATSPIYKAWSIADGATIHQAANASKSAIGTLDQFAWGIALALALHCGLIRCTRRAGLTAAAVGLVVTTLAMIIYAANDPAVVAEAYWLDARMVVAWPSFFTFGVACLLLAAVAFDRTTTAFAHHSGLKFTGKISYSLYLFHPIVIAATFEAGHARGWDVPGVPVLAAMWIGIFGLSWLAWRLIEQPAIDLARSA